MIFVDSNKDYLIEGGPELGFLDPVSTEELDEVEGIRFGFDILEHVHEKGTRFDKTIHFNLENFGSRLVRDGRPESLFDGQL